MSRRDDYLDALLKHLGATYYQTVHGDATATDVARALEAVADQTGPANGPSASGQPAPGAAGLPLGYLAGKRRVRDVMTTEVVTITPRTSCKHTARLLHDNRVSAVPVLAPDGQVAGVVSEADLLPKQDQHARHRARLLPGRSAKAGARTAAELMTAPAITIGPDALVGAAARLMQRHHLKRLPVVDAGGQLIGIVSRHDLLKVFLRPDDQIAAEIAGVLTAILLLDPASVAITVRDGIVTLAGQVEDSGQIQAAVKLAGDVDGVIAVTSRLTSRQADTWTRPPG
jgi:CBS domain-containing protein